MHDATTLTCKVIYIALSAHRYLVLLLLGKDDIAAVVEKLLDWSLPIDNLHKSKTVQT